MPQCLNAERSTADRRLPTAGGGLVALIVLAIGVGGAAQAPAPRIALTDITREAGITARHDNGAAGGKLLPETMGAGAAFFDYDNDGDQDLLFVNGLFPGGGGGRYATLYRNDGTGRFTDVSAQTGLQTAGGSGTGYRAPGTTPNTDLSTVARRAKVDRLAVDSSQLPVGKRMRCSRTSND